MSSGVKEHQDHTKKSIFHHGLIKIIISTMLRKKEKTWDYFLFWSGFQSEKENQAQKRQLNKGHNLVKKLKKRVTVEIKEDNVPTKSMTQRDENVEDEQQTNIEENEISKAGMKDLEPVEDSEDQNKKIMKGKKIVVSENKPVFTETKISEIFKEVRKKMI